MFHATFNTISVVSHQHLTCLNSFSKSIANTEEETMPNLAFPNDKFQALLQNKDETHPEFEYRLKAPWVKSPTGQKHHGQKPHG